MTFISIFGFFAAVLRQTYTKALLHTITFPLAHVSVLLEI